MNVRGLLIILSLLATAVVAAGPPPAMAAEPPQFVTLGGNHEEGWALVEDEKHWLSSGCRARLETADVVFETVTWSQVGALPAASPSMGCDQLLSLVGAQSSPGELVFVTNSVTNEAGWVLTGGTRQWLDPDCRQALEAVGINFVITPWRTFSNFVEQPDRATCEHLATAAPKTECATFADDHRMISTAISYSHAWDVIVAGRDGEPVFLPNNVDHTETAELTPQAPDFTESWGAVTELTANNNAVVSMARMQSEQTISSGSMEVTLYTNPSFTTRPPGGDVLVRDPGSAQTGSTASYGGQFTAGHDCVLQLDVLLSQNQYSWHRDSGRATAQQQVAVEQLIDGEWSVVQTTSMPAYLDGQPIAVELEGDYWEARTSMEIALESGDTYRLRAEAQAGESYQFGQPPVNYSAVIMTVEWAAIPR